MRKILTVLIISLNLLLLPFSAIAQQSPKVEIAGTKVNGDNVEYTLTSDKPFYFADNTYILHIGLNEFKIYKQWKVDGKGKMMFVIPVNDYNKLMAGDDEWLTYGNKLHKEAGVEMNVEAECKQLPNSCWWLGKYSGK